MILEINPKDYKSNKKDKCPYTKFYYSLAEEAGLKFNKDKFAPDVTKFTINPKDAIELRRLSDMWVGKQMRGFAKKYIDSNASFHWMNYSPREDDKIKEGTVRFPKRCLVRINKT